jgi:GNAT superfamily N-acetyltransferase
MSQKISLAKTDEEIQNCYAVMNELRQHIPSKEFLQRIKKQEKIADYKLAYLLDEEVKAVAGFRISECLAWGKFLWVDDLVSKSRERSKGYGGMMFDWLVEYAKKENCEQLHLDSHVQRFDAHRFYLNKRMIIEAHHFSMRLK